MEDPVKGRWTVPRKCTRSGVVWCDSSNIAMGVLLEIEGKGIEDAAWLRKKGDVNHINVAELESIIKGVNLALKWGLTQPDDRFCNSEWVGECDFTRREEDTDEDSAS